MDLLFRLRLRSCDSHPEDRVSKIPLLRFEVVSFFAVLRHVQTFYFVFFARAEARYQVSDFQNHNCADKCESPRNQHTNQLVSDLTPVAVQTTHRFPRAENRVDDLLREYARQ